MAVVDNIRNALKSYGGFTIDERIYNYLGSLGYTGTNTERVAKYEYEGCKGWNALVKQFGHTEPTS